MKTLNMHVEAAGRGSQGSEGPERGRGYLGVGARGQRWVYIGRRRGESGVRDRSRSVPGVCGGQNEARGIRGTCDMT